LRVVENPVTVVLYSQFPFVKPYCTTNEFNPAYGPQLRKILVELTLLDSRMVGVTQLRFGQLLAAGAETDPPEPDVEVVEEVVEVEGVHVVDVIVSVAVDTVPP
jgi:hypothetical protein